MHNRLYYFAWCLAVLFVLSACMSMPKLKTAKQQLFAIHTLSANVLQTAIDLRKSGLIDDEMKATVTRLFNLGDRLIDEAEVSLHILETYKEAKKLRILMDHELAEEAKHAMLFSEKLNEANVLLLDLLKILQEKQK